MKRLLRIISGSIILLAMVAVLLYGVIRAYGLPLGVLAKPLGVVLATMVPEGSVDIEGARIDWSSENNFLALTIGQLRIRETADAGMLAEDIYIELSGTAFWQDARFALAKALVGKLTIMPSQVNDLPAATGLLLPSGGGDGFDNIKYISEFAIRDIVVKSHPDAASNGSHLLVQRKGNRLSAMVQIAYGKSLENGSENGEAQTSIVGTAEIGTDGAGQAEIELSQLDPRDIGRFSNLLTPLRGIQLPVTAMMNVNFAKGGALDNGSVDLFVAPGLVQFTGAPIDVRELVVGAEVDFTSGEIDMRDARFNVSGVAGQLSGMARYSQNDTGRLQDMSFALTGSGARVDLPRFFKQVVNIPRARLNGVYDFASAALEIDRLEVEHNFGKAVTVGVITLHGRNPHFDITTDFGAMTREGAEGLWPLTISPEGRAWTEKNLVGGKLRAGSLAINSSLEEMTKRQKGDPMREDALLLDLDFEQIGVRYMAHLPILQESAARLFIRGSSMEVRGAGGTINLPDADDVASPVNVETVRFFTPNYRDRMLPVSIDFSGDGVARDIIRALNRPPLRLFKPVDFDFERLLGNVRADVALRVPVFAPRGQRKVDYQIAIETRNLEVTGKLGDFKLSQGRGHISFNNQGLAAQGRIVANGVDSGFAWRQPFGAERAKQAQLAVHGFFSPQDVADLGQEWAATRLFGKSHVNLLINGPVNRPLGYRVFVDLEPATFTLRPLAYTKPADTPASLEAVIGNAADGKPETIRARLKLPQQDPLRVSMRFDGPVMSAFEMTPLSIGRDKNLVAKVETYGDQRLATMTAKQMDVSRLFYGGNREVELAASPFALLSFLGEDAVMELRVDKLVGDNNVEMDEARLRVVREKGLHEKFAFQGVFKDGSDMLMDIARETDTERKFLIQAERAGNLFRMFDWAEEIYGGNLVIHGRLYDDGMLLDGRQRELSGRMTMTDYRARNVPVLASIVSLASLRGIADTLSGDGIEFKKAQGNFSLGGGRLTIKDGRMHGPAVGITVQGDYDLSRGDVDMGGTVIPSYTLNSFFGKIPIVGQVLSGRKGEGILGIGYRVSGEAGEANVLVNPLSVLTPGFLRRVFEIGIGLGDEEGGDTLPELDEPGLSE